MNKIALTLACLLAVGGCYVPDKVAIKSKLRDECRIAPAMPACAYGQEEVEDLFWDDFIYSRFGSVAEEQCVLETDCDGETVPTETFIEGMQACGERYPGPTNAYPVGRRDFACLQGCEQALMQCGGDECTVLEAQVCLDEREACKQACPPG